MIFSRQRAFTLIEMLVVIAIIGTLAAALSFQIPKMLETARTAKCQANLKNLTRAALNYGVDNTHMPWAGSFEVSWPTYDSTSGNYTMYYYERKGWVGWTGAGKWPNKALQGGGMKTVFYGQDGYEAITNGTLWAYVNRDLSTYLCDTHKKNSKLAGLEPMRSYVMNGYFGYSNNGNGKVAAEQWISPNDLSARGSAASLLLFAELPAYKGSHQDGIDSSTYMSDGVLETDIRTSLDQASTSFRESTASETIGFNHKVSKRWAAHVAFADGHVGVLWEPSNASQQNLEDLTMQLCNGDELSLDLQKLMH